MKNDNFSQDTDITKKEAKVKIEYVTDTESLESKITVENEIKTEIKKEEELTPDINDSLEMKDEKLDIKVKLEPEVEVNEKVIKVNDHLQSSKDPMQEYVERLKELSAKEIESLKGE